MLGAVAVLAAASPVAVYGITSAPSEIRVTTGSSPTTIAPKIAEVLLANVPDIVLPLAELTGLDLPDLHLKDVAPLSRLSLPGPGDPVLPGPGDPVLPGPGDPVLPGLSTDVADRVTPAARPTRPDLVDRAGVTVKELTRGAPFSMVALTAANLTSAEAEIRARQADGTWGPWMSADPIDTYRDDRATADGKTGTEPIFVGETTAVQVLVAATPTAPAPVTGAAPGVAAPGSPFGYTPVASSHTRQTADPVRVTAKDVTAVLIEPGASAADGELSDIATPVDASSAAPKVISRKQWGADESLNCQDPTYDDFLAGATVHHTAGNNNYSKAESAGIVRAIYAYHARTLGWCDIGYNVLVDKYGQMFEGRAGGLDKPVQGAHAGGFNENTMGIAMMGDFSSVDPPQATINAVGKFLGWRLGKAGLSPKGTTTMYSEGTSFTPYPQGTAVKLPVIFAHRDVGNTECPGDAGYAHMDEIRDIAANNLASTDTKTSTKTDTKTSTKTDAKTSTKTSTDRLASNSPRSQVPDTDASASTEFGAKLPGLMTEILRLTDNSPLAQKWVAEGGDTGRLGAARSGIRPAKAGFQHADFDNGSIYTAPNGRAWTVLGEIYRAWQGFGGDNGELGLPVSDEYSVAGGFRSDFEYGSLIFNELTGAVTKVLKVYNDTYRENYLGNATQTPAAPTAPAAPAPAG